MTHSIGVDIGTSSCRAVAFDDQFQVLASCSREYPVTVPRPGWAEQDPDLIVESVVEVLKGVLAHPALRGSRPIGIGFSSVMHSVVGVDANGCPVTKAIIWADLRAKEEAARLAREFGGSELYSRTGCPVHPTYLPAKLLWLKENAPGQFKRIAKVLSIKGYVLQRLTGQWLEEYSTASTTGLFNLHTMKWDDLVLKAAGISRDVLPPLVAPLTVLEGFTSDYAHGKGLPSDIPVVVGATDGTLSNLGSGVVSPGQMVAMIGTSGALRVVLNEPKLDPKQRTWSYYLAAGKWVSGGAINNGGNIMKWYRDCFGAAELAEAQKRGVDVYQLLSERAGKAAVGSGGLIFLPMLFGERSPGWNPDSRGVLFGLSASHGPAEITRAIMEGVLFHLYGVYEALVEVLGRPREVRASGGFARSRLWLQIMADVFGTPLQIPQVLEGSAFGAAFLATMVSGQVGRLEDASEYIHIQETVYPDERRTKLYKDLYQIYCSIYSKLAPEFVQIARFQTGGQ